MPDAPSRLFLIDGYALIYRAHHALRDRPLRNKRGENTSIPRAVLTFLTKLIAEYHPEALVWINDAGDSGRTAEYPAYKATRVPMEEVEQQEFDRGVERVQELLAALRVPLVAVDGWEADDVIGSLAEQARQARWQAVIVSGDKDFYQLIGGGVVVLNPGRGGAASVDPIWVDESNAQDRLGVPPAQVADYLALVGDTADNVPGVRGIGEKGAAELLRQYGDLETLLAHAGEIKQKRYREGLEQHAAEARLSRRLVTIRHDAPVRFDVESFAKRAPDPDALARVYAELEFTSLLRQLGAEVATAPAAPTDEPVAVTPGVPGTGPAVSVVDDVSGLPALIDRLRRAPLLALDTETSSLDPHSAELIGLSLAASPTEVWYLPFGHRPAGGELAAPAPVRNLPAITDPACRAVAELLRDAAVPKAGHNIKYDWQVLRRAGIELGGVTYDSMLASFVLDPGRRSHAIDVLSLEHLNTPMRSYTDVAGKGKMQVPFAEVPVTDAAAYCGHDSAAVLALHAFFAPRLAATGLAHLLTDLEMPLVPVLVDMEWTGIAIDRKLFAKISGELAHDLQDLESRIAKAAGASVNLNSPKQLGALLFEKLQLPVLKKTKTGASTDAEVLDELAGMGHEVPKLILEYREVQKLKSTYVDVLPAAVHPDTGRIHTSFHQTGAATGRLSSSDPNLQNIPVRTPRGEEIRRAFVPASGCKFIVADYSQIELRLLAHFSEDPAFIEAFHAGGDIHRGTAAIIFGVPESAVTPEMRSRAKTINFGTIYGQGPFALSRQLGISQEEAKAFITQYFERFSGVRAWLDQMVELARAQGYVETLFGRRRYIPEVKDRNFSVRSFGERVATNSPLQGSAADLLKLGMIRLHHALLEQRLDAHILLQVHDELVVEAPAAVVPEVERLVREKMEGAAELRVPLVVSVGVGDNWLDAKH
ncbi:MAG TPA: DNA polymerase I [Gemmatimonadales bacterium]|nr:DNA polymerase I [Gemmatimonadales bacterium]